MMRLPLVTLSALASALLAGVFATCVQAQSTPPGAVSRNNQLSLCIGCHGIANYHTAFPVVYHVPKIAGQSPQYIIKALQAYRAGERSHPSMQGIAKSLSDQDMAELAANYGGGAK